MFTGFMLNVDDNRLRGEGGGDTVGGYQMNRSKGSWKFMNIPQILGKLILCVMQFIGRLI